MKYKKITPFSSTTLNSVGDILRKDDPTKIELTYAVGTLDSWRASHAYPMNTFQATLRKKISSIDGKVVIAQRLKRLPTIIDKLKRYPDMQLSRMQDIGGLRAILETVKQVRALATIYKNSKFNHELVNFKDYITSPKDSGYRGIHLVYKYKNPVAPQYEGMLIELQFRTKIQHNWATAVETMGTFSGKALKSSQGDEEILNFFKISSSAFAYLENTKIVPGYDHLSRQETYKAVIQAEKKLDIITKMRGFTTAAKIIENDSNKGRYYHLIILDYENKSIQVSSYSKNELKKASKDYIKAEKRAAAGLKIDSVLVSAGPLTSLKKAYPNYFLDTQDFIKQIERIKSLTK